MANGGSTGWPVIAGELSVQRKKGLEPKYIALYRDRMEYYKQAEDLATGLPPRGQLDIDDVLDISFGATTIAIQLADGKDLALHSEEETIERWGRAFKEILEGWRAEHAEAEEDAAEENAAERVGEEGAAGVDGAEAENTEGTGVGEVLRSGRLLVVKSGSKLDRHFILSSELFAYWEQEDGYAEGQSPKGCILLQDIEDVIETEEGFSLQVTGQKKPLRLMTRDACETQAWLADWRRASSLATAGYEKEEEEEEEEEETTAGAEGGEEESEAVEESEKEKEMEVEQVSSSAKTQPAAEVLLELQEQKQGKKEERHETKAPEAHHALVASLTKSVEHSWTPNLKPRRCSDLSADGSSNTSEEDWDNLPASNSVNSSTTAEGEEDCEGEGEGEEEHQSATKLLLQGTLLVAEGKTRQPLACALFEDRLEVMEGDVETRQQWTLDTIEEVDVLEQGFTVRQRPNKTTHFGVPATASVGLPDWLRAIEQATLQRRQNISPRSSLSNSSSGGGGHGHAHGCADGKKKESSLAMPRVGASSMGSATSSSSSSRDKMVVELSSSFSSAASSQLKSARRRLSFAPGEPETVILVPYKDRKLREVFDRCSSSASRCGYITTQQLWSSCRESALIADFFGIDSDVDAGLHRLQKTLLDVPRHNDNRVEWEEFLQFYRLWSPEVAQSGWAAEEGEASCLQEGSLRILSWPSKIASLQQRNSWPLKHLNFDSISGIALPREDFNFCRRRYSQNGRTDEPTASFINDDAAANILEELAKLFKSFHGPLNLVYRYRRPQGGFLNAAHQEWLSALCASRTALVRNELEEYGVSPELISAKLEDGSEDDGPSMRFEFDVSCRVKKFQLHLDHIQVSSNIDEEADGLQWKASINTSLIRGVRLVDDGFALSLANDQALEVQILDHDTITPWVDALRLIATRGARRGEGAKEAQQKSRKAPAVPSPPLPRPLASRSVTPPRPSRPISPGARARSAAVASAATAAAAANGRRSSFAQDGPKVFNAEAVAVMNRVKEKVLMCGHLSFAARGGPVARYGLLFEDRLDAWDRSEDVGVVEEPPVCIPVHDMVSLQITGESLCLNLGSLMVNIFVEDGAELQSWCRALLALIGDNDEKANMMNSREHHSGSGSEPVGRPKPSTPRSARLRRPTPVPRKPTPTPTDIQKPSEGSSTKADAATSATATAPAALHSAQTSVEPARKNSTSSISVRSLNNSTNSNLKKRWSVNTHKDGRSAQEELHGTALATVLCRTSLREKSSNLMSSTITAKINQRDPTARRSSHEGNYTKINEVSHRTPRNRLSASLGNKAKDTSARRASSTPVTGAAAAAAAAHGTGSGPVVVSGRGPTLLDRASMPRDAFRSTPRKDSLPKASARQGHDSFSFSSHSHSILQEGGSGKLPAHSARRSSSLPHGANVSEALHSSRSALNSARRSSAGMH